MAVNLNSKREDVKELTLRVKLEHLNEFERYKSKVFFIQGYPWKVEFIKRNSELAVVLISKHNFNQHDSYIIACSKVELISWKPEVQPYVKFLLPCWLNSENPKGVSFHIISWIDLMDRTKGYVDNENCIIDIYVKATALQMEVGNDFLEFKSVKSCEDCSQQKFRLTIKRFIEFFSVSSPKISFAGISWRIGVIQIQDYLAIILKKNGSIDGCLGVVVKLNSFDLAIEPFKRELTLRMYEATQNIFVFELLPIKYLVDPTKSFIRNNSFVVEVDIEFEKENQMAINQLASDKDKKWRCPICYEDLEKLPLSTLQCGHIHCHACLARSVLNHGRCPKCNAPAALGDLRRAYLPS